jgi:hypothetical protein
MLLLVQLLVTLVQYSSLKDATISAVAGESIGNIAKLQTSFSAGTVIYGKFTSVTLSAGLVALHKI